MSVRQFTTPAGKTVWQAQVSGFKTGTKRRSKDFDTQVEALKHEQQLKAEKAAINASVVEAKDLLPDKPDQTDVEDCQFGWYINYFMQNKWQNKGDTCHRKAERMMRIIGAKTDVRTITRQMINTYISNRRNEYKPDGTRQISDECLRRDVRLICKVLDEAAYLGKVDRNDLPDLKRIEWEKPKLRRTYLEPEWMQEFLKEIAAMQKIFTNPDLSRIISLKAQYMWAMGCRSIEARRLEWGDIDWSPEGDPGRGFVTYKDTKNGTDATLGLTEEAEHILQQCKCHGWKSPFPITYKQWAVSFRKAADIVAAKFGLTELQRKEFVGHGLRRTFLTSLVASGATGPDIQLAAGHSSQEQAKHYLMTNTERLERLRNLKRSQPLHDCTPIAHAIEEDKPSDSNEFGPHGQFRGGGDHA